MNVHPEHPYFLPQGAIIGHRGLAGLAPENTVAALSRAHEFGLEWVEFDVQPCRSGEWLVFHDSHLERTTNGHGRLREHTYRELQKLDNGAWFGPAFQGSQLVRAETFISEALALGLKPNIEIKLDTLENFQEIDDLMRIITALWPAQRPKPLISSFNFPALKYVRQAWPCYPCAYLIEHFHPRVIHLVQKLGFVSLNCHHVGISLAECQSLQAAGIPLLLFTINDKAVCDYWLKAGVAGVFSDYPLANADYLKDPHLRTIVKG